jgi:peptidoglycan LD-endopeptidase CwlK
MTREKVLQQDPASLCPQDILGRQVLLPVRFYDFSGASAEGEVVIDRDLERDVAELFALLFEKRFPIASAIPVASPLFGWDDARSMRANNTSGFNYRPMTGSAMRPSNHALGRAIDINPLLNPYIKGDIVLPAGAVYNPARPGTIDADSFIVWFLKDHGWTWGGDWTSLKDYQHFEKTGAL